MYSNTKNQAENVPDNGKLTLLLLYYGAWMYDPLIGRWKAIDPMAEQRYSITPYNYCSNNPINRIDPNGEIDYYCNFTGKFLGAADIKTDGMRMIDASMYNRIFEESSVLGINADLFSNSQAITIDNATIQSNLQAVADNSINSGMEHQMYITLDRKTATISSMMGPHGDNKNAFINYFPAPATGVNFIDKPGGLVLIGQAHGHPATTEVGKVTARTMSTIAERGERSDEYTSRSIQIPVYGLDAMDGKTGVPVGIHRITPNGIIINNVGKTSSGFNIGRDAMRIWGRR